MALSAGLKASYTPIIDGILRVSDLDQISAKKIRQGLQGAVDHDISDHKQAINELIHQRFDVVSTARRNEANGSTKEEKKPSTNGSTPLTTNGTSQSSAYSPQSSPAKRSNTSDDLSDVIDDAPPKKKVKKVTADSDAALAARLQAEENGMARPTRGGGTRKKATSTKKSPTKKKKSASKIKADDDSDVESGSEEAKEPKRNGAFHKPMSLSEPLASLTGETTLSRPQTVKKIWDHVKANDLQNPEDKRQIRCDEPLRAIFKQDTIHMFTMNKILSKHLFPVEE